MALSYRSNIVVRVTVILVTVFLIAYLSFAAGLYFTAAGVALLLIVQTILLIRYTEGVDRRLSQFFRSIENDDFSTRFPVDPGRPFQSLTGRLNELIQEIGGLKAKNEAQYLYLKTVVDQAAMGLIVIENDDRVNFINRTALKYLNLPVINKVDDLYREHPALKNFIKNKRPLAAFLRIDSTLTLSVRMSTFRQNDRYIRIVTLQNIRREIEETESASWEKLIRVLSHEIMNSITPILTLSQTITQINVDAADRTALDEIVEASGIIARRSRNLMTFIDNYRSLLSLPSVNAISLELGGILDDIEALLRDQMKAAKIVFRRKLAPVPFRLHADRVLLEQIMINLVRNAAEALEEVERPVITFTAFHAVNGNTIIQVIDNGRGIPAENLGKVFVPFFSTTKNGNGIGLSLTREIMRLHGGSVTIESDVTGTTVSLIFESISITVRSTGG